MSTRLRLAIAIPTLLLVGAIAFLRMGEVKLGQGSFHYLYSPWVPSRLLRLLFAVPAMWMVWRAIAGAGRLAGRSLAGRPLGWAICGVTCLAVWSWCAQPMPLMQHYLNWSSPSQDGAFVLVTAGTPSVRAYVRIFPTVQTQTIDSMRGTRVLSNPPGMTILTLFLRDTIPPDALSAILSQTTGAEDDSVFRLAVLGMQTSMLMTVLWALATWPLYLAARRFLPASSALAVAVIAVFAPSALEFAPGKDTAQMLISAVMLLGAAMVVRPGEQGLRAAALGGLVLGAATALGAVMGLLMVWVGIACALWALWVARKEPKNVSAFVVGGLLGFAGAAFGVWAMTGYEVVTGSMTVARVFAAVQPQIKVDRRVWTLIGLPIVLLFTPVGLIVPLLLRRRHATAGAVRRTSWALLVVTVVVMGATYVVGVPYELPRLWTPFLPLLVLGAFLSTNVTFAQSPRAARIVALIATSSVMAAAVHWAHMDVRESEFRLATGRAYH